MNYTPSPWFDTGANHGGDEPAAAAVAWGATLNDWSHFARTLGLEADLLPVVSDPAATISPDSKMKDKGKTPSRFNARGEVVGIPKWTQHQATDREIGRWSKDSRLGICVQTRHVKAIDIDIADEVIAAEVREFIALGLGALPLRRRDGTGKCLLLVRLPAEFPKRVIKTAHGIIELLSTGQQFIAIGTHPSGARYEWVDTDGVIGLPAAIPEVTMAELDVTWQALIDKYGLPDGAREARLAQSPTKPRRAVDIDDPVVDWLDTNGWVTGHEPDGKVNVRCPWEQEHTTDTGPSATTWFPAGVGGFAQGHFRCLHAHCSHRGDAEFLEATGYGASGFEVVPAVSSNELLPAFERVPSTGRIKPTRQNIRLALTKSALCGQRLRFDTFRDSIMVAPTGTEAWRTVIDADYSELCLHLERGKQGFAHIPRDLMREMVETIARRDAFDSANHWLASLQWDGVQRAERLLVDYLGAEDTPYTRAVGCYTMTALAGRVIEPGVKVDMVPVLVGPQGAGKSSVVSALSPSRDAFLELDLGKSDDDQAREMRGVLVVELGELKGLRAREQEALKAFITRREDVWVEKWKTHATRYARRSVFIGTTNSQEFLVDDTGHRRWLPVNVPGAVSQEAVAALAAAVERDRDQLWAEGAAMFRESGVQWRDAERLARAEHSKFEMVDPWGESIRAWLDSDTMDGPYGQHRGDGDFTTETVLTSAINLELRSINDQHRKRVAAILRKLGYRDRRRMDGGLRATRWSRAVVEIA